MMQITGKSAPSRGLTLLLALMLGAGLALTGCGDDDSSTTTPTPAPAPAPPAAPDPPGTPGNLRVASTGTDYIEFSWDSVEGATAYEVEMSMTEGDFNQARKATVTATMHKFTGLAPETTAYGRVRSTNDDGASDWSEAVPGASMAAPLVLSAPMPTVASTGPDHIEWSWEPVENALGYQVQVADSMDGLDSAEMELQTSTMKRIAVEPQMERYIRVRAVAGTPTSPVASDWSDAVMGMSAAAPLVAPMPTVSSAGPDHIEFSWEPVEGATGYVIQISMMEDDFSEAQQAAVSGTMHRFEVDAETTVYARVRATDGERASDWSDAVMGMSEVAPLVLSAPMPKVKATGHDFIEWEWNAVEGATAYDVRVADSMDGLDDADMESVTETMHRVDAEPEMEMYIQVRAAADTEPRTTSDWSEAAKGMSDVAPMPFMVSMTPPEAGADRACSGQAFCPDSMTDVKKAMAGPNKMMTVTSSHQAQISPMYVDDAAAVDLNIGDNTPFQFVAWDAMQSMVATDGVTFRLQRISTAAGQEPMPMGDMMYITCGPFECSDAMDEVPDAPDISIANSQACTDFEAELTLNVGLGYNGGNYNGQFGPGTVHGSQEERKRGIDAGWTYTSTSAASVMHEFVGVIGADGGSLKVRGSSLSKTSTPMALGMTKGTGNNANVNHFGGSYADATTAGGGPIWNGTQDCFSTSAPAEDAWNTTGYSYANISGAAGVAGTLQKPQNCFRIITAGRPSRTENTSTRQNFLPGYTVHVTPNASVTWAGSSVSWPKGQDPFDGLDCDGVSFDAVDDTDVCGSFQEQATGYWGRGVGNNARTSDFMFEYIVTTDGNKTVDTVAAISASNPPAVTDGWVLRRINIIPRMTNPTSNSLMKAASVRRAPNSVWSSLWLVNSTKKTSIDVGDFGERRGRDNTVADADLYRPEYGQGAFVRGYLTTGTDRDIRADLFSGGPTTGPFWRPLISVNLIDSDGDPMHGDFGKVDFDERGTDYGKADNFPASNSDADACSSADNGGAGDAPCDAEAEFDESFTLTLHQDTSNCTQTIEVSFTCTWDADGQEDRTGDGQAPAKAFGAENIGNFVTCKMS